MNLEIKLNTYIYITALILSICACNQPSSDTSQAKPSGGPSGLPMDGPSIYARVCQSCHGPTGKGNGPRARMLSVRPTDFTSLRVQSAASDEEWARVVAQGRGKMPAFQHRLSEEQTRAVVAHLRSFQAAPQPSP